MSDSNGNRIQVVRFKGELDLGTADEFASRLFGAAGDGAPVIVDLSDCTFIDSMGISLLLRAARSTANGARGRLALVGVHDQVARVMKLTGVDGELPSFGDVPAARVALSGG